MPASRQLSLNEQQNVGDALDTVHALIRAGDMAAARHLLGVSMAQEADTPEVTHQFGLLLVHWGEIDAAIAILEKAMLESVSPSLRATLHNDVGVLYHRQGRSHEALAAFHSALACDVTFAAAHENLASLHADAIIAATPVLLPERTLYKYRLRALYQEAILACMRHRVSGWWTCTGLENLFYCNAESPLRRMLREFILHGANDVAAYRRLSWQLDAISNEVGNEASETRTLLEALSEAPTRAAADNDQALVSSAALMNGLLSLHMAETHPAAQTQVPALREAARAIWDSGRDLITPASDAEHLHQIVRMLGHFDLLPEARDCLSLHAPQGAHARALSDWMRLRDINAAYAQNLNAQGDHGAETYETYVVGITVWGPEFLDFFGNYHLPSLLAKGNLPSLAARGKLVVSIVTDAAGRAWIAQSAALGALAAYATVHFTVVDSVPARATPEEARTFYMRYGLLEHHHVYLARDLGANLLLMPTDTVISQNGYATLAREIQAGYDCCTVACMESQREAVQPEIEAFRQEGVIAADAEALMAIAVRHKTDYFNSLIVDPAQRMNAHPREFFWRVPGGYVCHSIFMHPIMLSARVMAREFHPNHENVDWALLPRVMQGDGRVKVLDDASDLFILHCSEGSPRDQDYASFTGRITPALGEYLLVIHEHDFPIHRDLLRHAQFFAVEDGAVAPSGNYLSTSTALTAMFDMTLPVSG